MSVAQASTIWAGADGDEEHTTLNDESCDSAKRDAVLAFNEACFETSNGPKTRWKAQA